MADNQMRLQFASLSQNEGFARSCAAAFATQMNPTIEELSDIRTAVSEAVTNAIIHGYENGPGTVRLDCTIDGDLFTAVVHDDGVGIGDMELERSGMGFTVMEAFMEEVVVESAAGSGTTVTLKKRIGRRSEP